MLMKNGTITLKVQSSGITGPEWKERLYRKNYSFDSIVNSILEYVVPTNGFVYNVVIVNGNRIENEKITITEIFEKYSGGEEKLQAPPLELAFILMDILAGARMREIGLESIVFMVEPFQPKVHMFGCNKLQFCEMFERNKWYLTQDVKMNEAISPKRIGFAFVSGVKSIY
jgi:hypothetical protein